MHKASKGFSTLALLASFNLFASTSSALADTFNSWEGLKAAITDGGGSGLFNIEPGAVLIATPSEYLYAGIFSGTLNGGTGDGIANINGLTRPLFESLRDANVSGLQLTAAADDPGGDGDNGVTGRGILADTATDSTINNVRVGGEVNLDVNVLEPWRNIDNVGGLVGTATNVTITNSHFTGSVYADGSNVGGLVGNLQNSTITNSTAKSSNVIEGANNVGGLVGISSNSVIDLAKTVGSIDASTAVGGIVGHATATDITQSLSKSLISATGDSVGGIAGVLANDGVVISELNNSIFKGSILSFGDPGQVGGIVGLNYGTIENVSAIPMDAGITGDIRVGGLVGLNETSGVVRNSYFDGRLFSSGAVGGIVGVNRGAVLNVAATGEINAGELCGIDAPDDPVCSGLIVGFNNGGSLAYSASTANLFSPSGDITNAENYYVPNVFPQHFLEYLNKDVTPSLWQIDSCYNDGRPFLTSIRSYVGACEDFVNDQPGFYLDVIPTLITVLAEKVQESKGFTSLVNFLIDTPFELINKLSELEINKIITSNFELNTIREITVEKELPIQLAIKGEIGSSAQVWVQTPEGDWINLGVITFDEQGNAILPALKFADLGNYKVAFFSNTTGDKELIDPSKGGAIGSINLQVK